VGRPQCSPPRTFYGTALLVEEHNEPDGISHYTIDTGAEKRTFQGVGLGAPFRTPAEQTPRIFPDSNRNVRALFRRESTGAGIRSPISAWFCRIEKVAAGSWGRAGRARTRSGDGEGWGRDRVAN
jgi:hypothetical protein